MIAKQPFDMSHSLSCFTLPPFNKIGIERLVKKWTSHP